MDDSWRFRPPIQSNGICPVCSSSHFPFCPPLPPYPHRLPPPSIHHPPFINHPTVHSLPPHPPHLFAGDEFLDRDPLRKRMRVEDLNPSRVSWDDERRLNLIREHGRQVQSPGKVIDRRFDPLPNPQNFDSYRNFQERRDLYGGEHERSHEDFDNYRNFQERRVFYDGEYDKQRSESERVFSYDRPLHPNESSSYSLPKQASYEMVPRIPNNELDRYPKFGSCFEPKPPFRDEIRKPFEAHVSHMPYDHHEYRVGVHSSQLYPPLPPQPPLPLPPEPSPPHSFEVRPSISMPPPMPPPVPAKVSAPLFPTRPVSQSSLESKPMVQPGFYREMPVQYPTGFVSEVLFEHYFW